MVKSVGCLDPGLEPEDHVMASLGMILSDRLRVLIAQVSTVFFTFVAVLSKHL